MKICMLVSTDMSHDARVWKEARTLAGQGHEVIVLAACNPALPADEVREGVRIIRVAPRSWRRATIATSGTPGETGPVVEPTQAPQPSRFRRWLWSFRAMLAGVAWIAWLRPDVVHVHDADRLFQGGIAHFLWGKPFVYDSHEFFAGLVVDEGLKWRLKRWWHLALERLLVSRAQAVITVNAAIGQRLQRRYRVRQLLLLHNFPPRTPAPAAGDRLRTRLPAEHRGCPVLLYQGRLTPQRGIEIFVAALAQVPEAVGVIVGGGPLRERLGALAEQKGLGNRLTFVPQVPWEELGEYTAGADLGFCLSQDTCENNRLALPNKLFEYLMAGVPAIVSDYPVLRQYVVREEIGAVVPPHDADRIAAVIRELLRQPERLAAMRQNALHVAQTKYNWEAQVEDLIDLYQRLGPRLSGATENVADQASLETELC